MRNDGLGVEAAPPWRPFIPFRAAIPCLLLFIPATLQPLPVVTMWAANCIHLQRRSFSQRSGDVGSVVEERKVIAATPDAVALGMICSRKSYWR